MKRIISFSGGKDSTALILWAKENLDEFDTIFCDTGWESDETYEYIQYINLMLLNGKLIVLHSKDYSSFEDLSIKKQRIPSSQARYCTEELKLIPTKNYISQYLPVLCSEFEPPEVEIYVGIRADESEARKDLPERTWSDFYNCFLNRPLIYQNVEYVFDLHKKYGVKPNPLYSKGFSRVGCYPCINIRLPELRQLFIRDPQRIDKIRELERNVGRSFFSPKRIPKRFHTGFDFKSGKSFPWIDDVIKYISSGKYEIQDEEGESCMSYYSICE
jgi:3'-phosphoadenosine 5'-phosphosulfate sulfotransferase (PAPS reductase)/FAD synthetase